MLVLEETTCPLTTVAASVETPSRYKYTFPWWHGLVAVYATLIGLVVWTWGSTSQVLVDYGRELYVAWQLAEGQHLYRDIAYFNGPFSPYFNSIVFRTFGVSVTSLQVANATILAVIMTVLFRQLFRYFSAVTTTTVLVAATILFGVGHLIPYGNYNFISPYSHEMTHGTLLAVLVFSLIGYKPQIDFRRSCVVGFLWGMVFLGKAEFFLAVTLMIVASITIPLLAGRSPFKKCLVQFGVLMTTAAVTLVGCWLLLSQQLGMQEAGLHLLGTWRYIFSSNVTQMHFYRLVTGLNDPLRNLLGSVQAMLAIAAALLAVYAAVRNVGGRQWKSPVFVIGLAAAVFLGGGQTFLLHARAFFVLAVILFLFLSKLAVTSKDNFEAHHHLACWAVFAACLLSKMMLRPTLSFYGFVLSMPVAVLALALAIEWLPVRLFANAKSIARFRYGILALLVLDTTIGLGKTHQHTSNKTHTVGTGREQMKCVADVGEPLQSVLESLSRRMLPDETLLVLPQGITINFLLRRDNPSPFVNFMPPELEMYGERNMVLQFERVPSDYVLLVSQRLGEYGKDFFGEPGYGDQIMAWVRENYQVQNQFGADPAQSREFGIQILKRNDAVQP